MNAILDIISKNAYFRFKDSVQCKYCRNRVRSDSQNQAICVLSVVSGITQSMYTVIRLKRKENQCPLNITQPMTNGYLYPNTVGSLLI